MRTLTLCLSLVACALPPPSQELAQHGAPVSPLSLRRVMADADWIGRAPSDPYWSEDSRSVYYSQKREGERGRDLFVLDLANGESRRVLDAERGHVDVDGGDYNREQTQRVFARNGDIFVSDLAGAVRQLTRTSESESSPAFLLDGTRVQFRRGGVLLVRELESGLEYEPATLRFEDDPLEEEDEQDEDYLADQQERLFDVLRERETERRRTRMRARDLHGADSTRAPLPWYLGDGKQASGSDLSPDGRWLLVRTTAEQSEDGKRDEMPEYVTDSSWVETREVRAHVGQTTRAATEVVLLDLEKHERHELDLSVFPGIVEDPLAWLSENDAEPAESPADDDTPDATPRDVTVWNVTWAPDASSVVFMARSHDNKDRWIARVSVASKVLESLHHLRDEAWINWRFNQLGWLDDSSGVWFLSEETGWSQLYWWSAEDASVHALTEGRFEIDSVESSPDGKTLYCRANAAQPGVHDIYRFALPDGPLEQVTDMGGRTAGSLSPDGSQLLLTHSQPLAPPELYVQSAHPGAAARRITRTVSDAFRSVQWVEPEIVAVPSRHGVPIYTRVYKPSAPPTTPQPIIAFVHGAGYLQNAHSGWSSYFREFMFHTLLVRAGYVVIDADFRASAGYGRDWRTAIYRGMGPPELDDYEDVLEWLVSTESVDLSRVGVYGGSYGGFVTLMGLFQRPDLFACGAALRPVTDWAHYNHGYTSNILNTPELDPEAYEASSPIEFAVGLTAPLLICHGLVDDNVLAKDSIRLAQRLIELEKEDWELALFPIEAHGFREPSSWLNEYRRIFKLFETHLK